MDRATFKLIAAIGVLVYGTLYVTGLIAIGLVYRDRDVVMLALLTAGVTYLSFLAHWMADYDRRHLTPLSVAVAAPLTWLSIVSGALAGVILLFG